MSTIEAPTRILAHRIELGDTVHTLAIADMRPDAYGQWQVRIEPFTAETPATSFHSGTLRITLSKNKHTPPSLTFIP